MPRPMAPSLSQCCRFSLCVIRGLCVAGWVGGWVSWGGVGVWAEAVRWRRVFAICSLARAAGYLFCVSLPRSPHTPGRKQCTHAHDPRLCGRCTLMWGLEFASTPRREEEGGACLKLWPMRACSFSEKGKCLPPTKTAPMVGYVCVFGGRVLFSLFFFFFFLFLSSIGQTG